MDARIQAVLDSAWNYAPAPQPVASSHGRLVHFEADVVSEGEDDDAEPKHRSPPADAFFPYSMGRYQRWILIGLLAVVLVWLWMPSSSTTNPPATDGTPKQPTTTPPNQDPPAAPGN